MVQDGEELDEDEKKRLEEERVSVFLLGGGEEALVHASMSVSLVFF